MSNVGIHIQIEGAKNAQGKIKKFSPQALAEIRKAAKERARQTVFRFKSEMAAEYTSETATGALASGVTYRTAVSNNGIDIQFYIKDRRELRYVTALLGGHFKQFPVGPFTIRPVNKRVLSIPFRGFVAQAFIRGAKGRVMGTTPASSFITGRRAIDEVVWGRKTGGFSRDVLSEVAKEEGALFVQDMQSAITNAVASLKS